MMSSNTLEALTPTGSFRMAYSSTVFNQVLTFIPRAQFKGFVHMHQGDRYVKKLTTTLATLTCPVLEFGRRKP